jgi:hypothetical protein
MINACTYNIANGYCSDYILFGLANLIATISRLNPDQHMIVSFILHQPVVKEDTELS